MQDRFVSIVIPSYNRIEMLKATIESLRRQTYPMDSFEIIVVDDGSSDGTSDWLAEVSSSGDSPAIRSFLQSRQGPAAARNLGVQSAKGDLIAFTDDDCIADPEWLSMLTAALDGEGRCIAGGRIVPAEMDGLVARYCTTIGFNCQAEQGEKTLQALNTANALCPKAAILDLGGFDTTFRWPGGEDTDLANRLIANGYIIKASADALIVHMNKDTFRGLHSAFFNRGRGHSIIHAKRKTGDFALYVLLCALKAFWNFLRVIVETPIVGIWNLLVRRMGLADAYGFAAMNATIKLAKYCGHVMGRLEYSRCINNATP